MSFLSKDICNILIRWDANIDLRCFQLYSNKLKKERESTNEGISQASLGILDKQIVSQVIVECPEGLIEISIPQKFLLVEIEKLRKSSTQGQSITALNNPVIGLNNVVFNEHGHILFLTLGLCHNVDEKKKKKVELKIPTLTPVVDQLWIKPSSCI